MNTSKYSYLRMIKIPLRYWRTSHKNFSNAARTKTSSSFHISYLKKQIPAMLFHSFYHNIAHSSIFESLTGIPRPHEIFGVVEGYYHTYKVIRKKQHKLKSCSPMPFRLMVLYDPWSNILIVLIRYKCRSLIEIYSCSSLALLVVSFEIHKNRFV